MESEIAEESVSHEEISRSDMHVELLKSFDGAFDKLESLWKSIGFTPKTRHKRSRVVLFHTDILFKQLVMEEENLSKRLVDSIERSGTEILKLSAELGLEPYEKLIRSFLITNKFNALTIPTAVKVFIKNAKHGKFQPDETLPLLDMEDVLRLEAHKLSAEKVRRMKKLQELQDQERPFYKALHVERFTTPAGMTVPSEKTLLEFQQHIDMLANELESRKTKFLKLKDTVVGALELLEQAPETQLEKEAANRELEADQLLSREHLAEIEQLCRQLKNKCAASEKEAEDLRREIVKLYRCLKVDEQEGDDFISRHTDFKSSTIFLLREELQRCKELKRQNVMVIVAQHRERLQDLWNKCCASDEQMQAFTPFRDDEYTEELIDLHMIEVQKWEEYWEKFHQLFLGIDELRELWQKVKDFEKKASDPNRFTNRGGKLLQEEKERKTLIKTLPVLELNLKRLASDWEKEHGQAFLVQGMTLPQFVGQCWVDHNQEKENEKMLRKIKQETSMNPGKRGWTAGTPSAHVSATKKAKCNLPTPTSLFRTPSRGIRKSPRNGKTPKLPPNHPLRTVLTENSQAAGAASNSTLVSIASYTDFKHDLNQTFRATCRSTAIQQPSPKLFVCGRATQKDKTAHRYLQRKRGNKTRRLITESVHTAQTPSKAKNKSGMPVLM